MHTHVCARTSPCKLHGIDIHTRMVCTHPLLCAIHTQYACILQGCVWYTCTCTACPSVQPYVSSREEGGAGHTPRVTLHSRRLRECLRAAIDREGEGSLPHMRASERGHTLLAYVLRYGIHVRTCIQECALQGQARMYTAASCKTVHVRQLIYREGPVLCMYASHCMLQAGRETHRFHVDVITRPVQVAAADESDAWGTRTTDLKAERGNGCLTEGGVVHYIYGLCLLHVVGREVYLSVWPFSYNRFRWSWGRLRACS
jgi:hypothetical protein